MRWRAASVLLTLLILGLAGASFTGAYFTARSEVNGTITTHSWFFLHNRPTPPTGNTTAQANLAMDAVIPLQTTLFNYDTNRDSLPGRRIRRGGLGATETRLAFHTNWRTPPFVAGRVIDGTVTARVWSGVAGFPAGARGVMVAYLRDYNPVTGTYTPIASATLDEPDWQAGSSAWVEKRIAIPVTAYWLAPGRQLELKLLVGATAAADMLIAYDTTAYPSALAVP